MDVLSHNYGGYPAPNASTKVFQDVNVGKEVFNGGIMGNIERKLSGYGVDLDGDGQFQGNKDGVLAFDINKDGRIDQKEIDESNRRLKLMKSDGPIMSKGPFADFEDKAAMQERDNLRREYDKDGDGKLNQYELKAAGGKLLVDRDQNGNFSSEEAQDIGSASTAGGRFSLDGLDYKNGSSSVQGNQPLDRGCNGRWYWMTGMYGQGGTWMQRPEDPPIPWWMRPRPC